jgi:hypothetical protein
MPREHSDPIPSRSSQEQRGDRRKSTRFTSEQVASCHPATIVDSIPVRIKDVSAHGVGLVSERRFEVGTVLVLELDRAAPRPLLVFCRVVRVAARGAGSWNIGCLLFDEMSIEVLEEFRTRRLLHPVKDRRGGVRVSETLKVACTRDSVGTLGHWEAEIKNLSPEGMGLVLPCEVEVGTRLRVFLPAQNEADEPCATLVQVVRNERRADGTWFMGCELCKAGSRKSVSRGEVNTRSRK